MLLRPECECVHAVSWIKLPDSLTLSAPVRFIFHIAFAPSFHTSSKWTFNTSWHCLQYVFLGCFYSVIPEQVKCLKYRVLTPFVGNALVIVFLHWSSVIIMHCELNQIHINKKSHLTVIKPTTGHQNTHLTCGDITCSLSRLADQ